MPNNVNVPGVGTVATDEITVSGAAHAQLIKLVDGSEDGTARIPGSTGFGLLVDVSRVSAAVVVSTQRSALVPAAPAAVSVGLVSAVAVAANANRKGVTLINTSPSWISIAFNAVAVLYAGISLAPNGGSFTMSEYDFSTLEIRAIASVAGSNLAIQEFN